MTLSTRAPLSSVLAQLGRALAARSSDGPLLDDPVFLPDFPMEEPDQAQEMRFGRSRRP